MKHYHGNKIMEQKFPARKFSGFILSFFFIFRNKICKLQTFCTPKMIWLVVTMCARTEWFIWCCPVQENKDSNGGVSAWRCSKESSERTIARVPSSPVHLYIRSIPVRFQWLIRRSRYRKYPISTAAVPKDESRPAVGRTEAAQLPAAEPEQEHPSRLRAAPCGAGARAGAGEGPVGLCLLPLRLLLPRGRRQRQSWGWLWGGGGAGACRCCCWLT